MVARKEKGKPGDNREKSGLQAQAVDNHQLETEEQGAATESTEAESQEKIIELEDEELAILRDRYTRLLADFDNYRKRQSRERDELVKYANKGLLNDLMPVIDHLELAITKALQEDDPFVLGVKLVYDQLLTVLSKYAMLPLDAVAEPFDPLFHEALSQTPSETVPSGTVIEQFRRGWLLAGKLLRPAQVIVSSGPMEEESPTRV